MNARSTPLRIVHACNFHYNRSGDKFDTLDQKIHQGFSENGHYIYPFPVHDIARQISWTCSKNGGTKGANLALVETCRKIQPDILLLGHAQSITRQTLERIRNNQPTIKIAQWFCDWLYSKDPNSCDSIFGKLDLLDSFFATTSGEKLSQFNRHKCRTAFFPNLVHPGIERHRSFEKKEHLYDIVFIGTDRKDPERTSVLLEIEKELGKDFKVGIFGSLGRPSVFGHEKDFILLNSKASLNLTRLPEPMKWYSSDRIASLLGNGILTCTRSEADLHEIYGCDSMVYYHDTSDLVRQLHHQLGSGDWRATARNGWERSHQFFNCRRITSLMIDFIEGHRDDCLGLYEIFGNECQSP
jgi:hypothetical protein